MKNILKWIIEKNYYQVKIKNREKSKKLNYFNNNIRNHSDSYKKLHKEFLVIILNQIIILLVIIIIIFLLIMK